MKRNLKKGDIVLIQDSNQIRGQWKLGKVSEVFPGEDSIVRKVHVTYKNPKQGEPAYIYIMEEDTLQSKDQLTDWYCFYQWTKRNSNLTEPMK